MRWVAGAAGPPADAYDADVVILSLNRATETVAAIGSALAQSGVSRHVFVVDQGSTPQALAMIAAAVAERDDATLVALDRNLGVAGGRNRGAALGHGRVIAGLDNDAEFATGDTLQRLVAALDADPGLGAVACRIVRHDTGADDLSSWGYPIGLLPYAGRSFETGTFVGAGHVIRRTAWDAVGGYDPALFFCWEEYDFCLRAGACGWRIRYRGDLVVRHKLASEVRVAWSADRWFFQVRNRLYIGRKYGDGWVALAPRMIGYLLKGLRNGLVVQTVRAMHAAVRMPLPACGPVVPRVDPTRRYRGGWLTRLAREVLAPLPVAERGGRFGRGPTRPPLSS
jgi:GT2 family glycosyltransferase